MLRWAGIFKGWLDGFAVLVNLTSVMIGVGVMFFFGFITLDL
jgi:hypothetical protein